MNFGQQPRFSLMDLRNPYFLGLITVLCLIAFGLPLWYAASEQKVKTSTAPQLPLIPCKVKVKVDADGKLVLDLQMPLGTAPLPEFDMSEWQSSLDAWREHPSAAEVERLIKRRMYQ